MKVFYLATLSCISFCYCENDPSLTPSYPHKQTNTYGSDKDSSRDPNSCKQTKNRASKKDKFIDNIAFKKTELKDGFARNSEFPKGREQCKESYTSDANSPRRTKTKNARTESCPKGRTKDGSTEDGNTPNRQTKDNKVAPSSKRFRNPAYDLRGADMMVANQKQALVGGKRSCKAGVYNEIFNNEDVSETDNNAEDVEENEDGLNDDLNDDSQNVDDINNVDNMNAFTKLNDETLLNKDNSLDDANIDSEKQTNMDNEDGKLINVGSDEGELGTSVVENKPVERNNYRNMKRGEGIRRNSANVKINVNEGMMDGSNVKDIRENSMAHEEIKATNDKMKVRDENNGIEIEDAEHTAIREPDEIQRSAKSGRNKEVRGNDVNMRESEDVELEEFAENEDNESRDELAENDDQGINSEVESEDPNVDQVEDKYTQELSKDPSHVKLEDSKFSRTSGYESLYHSSEARNP